MGTYSYSKSTTKTSQKPYQIFNDGKSANSQTVEYNNNRVSYEDYEDNDLDGRFGENESALTDSDSDGRSGESEAQTGVENVSQKQSVTVLNNMGLGRGLSSFQAVGQTLEKSAITVDKEAEEEEIKKMVDKKIKEEEEAEKNAKKNIRSNVLVS